MENLHRLKTEALIDLLSKQTAIYLQMQSEGGNDTEFIRCKLALRAIQKEISLRNKQSATDKDYEITND